MKLLFDTSVVIAAMVAAHPRHPHALPWLQKAQKGEVEFVLSAHSLAECYAVLTTLPVSPRITPGYALRLIEENCIKCASIVALTSREYHSLVEKAAADHLSGGIIYDLLMLTAAHKAKADALLTLNSRDFHRFIPPHASHFILVP